VEQTYVILLRGVTPTGKNRVLCADLRAALADTELHNVSTYIQSGNVIARSALDRTAVETLVRQAILQKIGPDLSIIARTHAQLKAVLQGNPFAPEASTRTYFTLLATQPAPQRAEDFLKLDFAPDAIYLNSDTLYTLYAERLSASRFNNNVYERKLKVAATTRNFNTITRLVELSA
jgi:uncharacterized protein (DUF1697 family)